MLQDEEAAIAGLPAAFDRYRVTRAYPGAFAAADTGV
jgi:hypothetical protein